MNKEEYELFKKQYLENFRGYYKKGRVKKSDIKKVIFDSKILQDEQKEDFWKLVKEEQ